MSLHFRIGADPDQKSTCNEHHAVNDRFIKYKGLDVTGVGATACGRHGCFCPGAVVDFQKGERSDLFLFQSQVVTVSIDKPIWTILYQKL